MTFDRDIFLRPIVGELGDAEPIRAHATISISGDGTEVRCRLGIARPPGAKAVAVDIRDTADGGSCILITINGLGVLKAVATTLLDGVQAIEKVRTNG